MGAITSGVHAGIALGDNIGSFWRRRKLEREMDTDRSRRRDLEDELRNERAQQAIERRAQMGAEEQADVSEIEAALQQMMAKPEGEWTPEDAAMAAALRRRRAALKQPMEERQRATQDRDQARIERQAEMGAAEYGSVDEIESALQQMMAKPEGEWTPEDAAMAAALRRARAAQGRGMAKVKEIDPETGAELEYMRPLSQVRRPQATDSGEQAVTTRPMQQQAEAPQIKPGTVVQQNGRRYRFRGGDPRDPANYEPMQ
jgi:hypothetical protein